MVRFLKYIFVAVLLMAVRPNSAQVVDSPALGNRLENPPNMVDRLVFFDSPEEWRAGELLRLSIQEEEAAKLILHDERERSFPRRGRYETEEFETDFPFTELLPSWNPHTPPDTGLSFQVRVRDAETGEWSPWLYMGQWGRTQHWPARTLRFERGEVNVDNLFLTRAADAFQMRTDFYSFNFDEQVNPSLRRLAVSYSGQIDNDELRAQLEKKVLVDGGWARDIPVPFLTQVDLDRRVSGSTCSPTSVSMLLWHNGIDRPLLRNALDIYDPEYGIFGNWTRAAALAGQYGFDAYVCRIRNWNEVKAYIAEGTPVIASIRFREGDFPSNPMKSTGGHLIVVRGLTAEGDAIVNDPALKEKGEGIVYKADELARAWFEKGGVAYIIRPTPEEKPHE